jgi:hypothetical protein
VFLQWVQISLQLGYLFEKARRGKKQNISSSALNLSAKREKTGNRIF